MSDNETDDELVDFTANATFTYPDGTTTTTDDFVIHGEVNLEHESDGWNELTAGLSEAIEDAQKEFQLSLEVPTKTLVCPQCDHPNDIPVWSFVNVEFGGDLEPLSGDYALGHQCPQCGFPY